MNLNNILPCDDDFSILSEPISIKNKKAANRFVYQPMEGCDGTPDGCPGELTIRRYTRFATGGPGIIWFEATAVQPRARANPRQLYLNKNNADVFAKTIYSLKELCLKENGYEPLIIIQLTHSGRYSKPEGKPAPIIACSNPLFEKASPISQECIITDDELDQVMEDLVNTAKIADSIGFDGADIKSCHRYLVSELLSAYERPGRYGGSCENRTRLLRESVRGAVENCSGDFIITTRMNAYDGFPYPYGFGVMPGSGIEPDLREAAALSGDLVREGVGLLNITMGNPYVNPHVNRPFSKGGYDPDEHPLDGVHRMLSGIAEIQAAVPEVPVISSGMSYLGVKSPGVAAACIRKGWFAMAGFGRMTLAYPELARDVIRNNYFDMNKCCITCSKCSDIMRTGGTPGCVIRDRDIYAKIYKDTIKK